MTLTKTRRAKERRQSTPRRSRLRQRMNERSFVRDPLVFLASVGVLEKANARTILEPWLREVLGESYFVPRARRITVEEIQELWRPHMQPGEKLSDLVIAMRDE